MFWKGGWGECSQVNVTAKVLEELDLALAEDDARVQWQRTRYGPVERGQDLSLVLPHVATVFQLQQV